MKGMIIGNTRPQIDIPSTYVLTPAGPLHMLTNIKWVLYENGKAILEKNEGIFTFQKSSLGKSYRLMATYTIPTLNQSTRSEINIVPVAGPPEITKITWEDCNFKDLSGREVGYLDTVYLVIQTKNIPYGDTLSVTVWEDEYADGHGDSSRNMGTLQARVEKNGKAELILSSTLLKAYQKKLNDKDWWDESEHEYYVQIKYIGKIDKIEDKTQLKVKNKLEQVVKPDNTIKPLTIEDSVGIVFGLVRPVKAEFKTAYDVCHDTVGDFNDYANFFVLESEGKYGYHWLGGGMARTTTDQAKPKEIPITITSTEQLTVTITIISHIESSISFRLKDIQGNYKFATEQKHRGKGKFEYKFTSTNASPPFKDHVRYFGTYNFGLEFAFEENKGTWLPAGANICVRLYVTKGAPLFLNFSDSLNDEIINNKVENKRNGDKETILESLLYIGCKYADRETDNNIIIDKVFEYFGTRSVERARIPGAMTYWKKGGESGFFSSPRFNNLRCVRFLLKYGEARCGEWSYFFRDIFIIQGFSGFEYFTIKPTRRSDTSGYINPIFLVKTWNISSDKLKSPVNQGGVAQDQSNQPMNFFWDHVFLKYNNKYYDPSYGIKSLISYSDNDVLLDDYSKEALTGVLYVKANPSGGAINETLHIGSYVDSITGHTTTNLLLTNKYEYKNINSSMQSHLVSALYPG